MKINSLAFFCCLASLMSCSAQDQTTVESNLESNMKIITGDTVCEIGGEIRSVFQDSKKNLWFASNGQGVFRFDGKRIIQFTDKHGLCSNFVWNIQESKNGNIWFKTNVQPSDVNAICCFDGNFFSTIQTDPNAIPAINYNYLNDELLFDYYYTGKSLVKIALPHTSPIKNDNNFSHFYDIYSTCKDKNGNVWLGTQGAGVCKYDGVKYAWLDDKELGSAVRSIFEDKNGTIWIGNNGDGLFRYSEGKLINFSREKKLENYDFEKYPTGKEGMMSRVWTITDDKQGNLWIGTIDNGVWMYDGKTVTNYTTKHGLGINSIWTIYKDKNDDLWFGTAGDGVYTFNGTTFEKFKP